MNEQQQQREQRECNQMMQTYSREGLKDGGSSSDERRSISSEGYTSDYELGSDAPVRQIKRRSETGPRRRGDEDIFVRASWTAAMTEMKKEASMDVSEGKLVKKVSSVIKKRIKIITNNSC